MYIQLLILLQYQKSFHKGGISSMQKEKNRIKTKAISIRVTEEQEKTLKQRAKKNGTSMTAYMWNRTLNENGNIYDKEFFDLVRTINSTLIYLKNHYVYGHNDTEYKELIAQIGQLDQEVRKVWQFLK